MTQPRQSPMRCQVGSGLWTVSLLLLLSATTTTTTTNAFVISSQREKLPYAPKGIVRVGGGDKRNNGQKHASSSSWRKRLLRMNPPSSSTNDERLNNKVVGWGNSLRGSSSLLSMRGSKRLLKRWSRQSLALEGTTNDDNDSDKMKKKKQVESNNNNSKEEKNDSSMVTQKWNAVMDAWNAWVEKALGKLPEPVRAIWASVWAGWLSVWEWSKSLRNVTISFFVGCFFATAAILTPIYSQVETLSRPVTLFETILSDLEQGYVDPVDTNKLFETGVSAMLRSLDPYTEYEGPQEAVELNESIDGKYGGVGLVISGITKPLGAPVAPTRAPQLQPQQQQQEAPSDKDASPADADAGTPVTSTKSGGAASGTLVAMEEEEDEEDFDEEEVLTRQQEQRQQDLAERQGIRVVNAFEGYSFDYGMRVGDRLVAIDDVPITPQTTVEGVRNRLRGQPGTLVSISFERSGVNGIQTITMPRSIVRVRDVKLATLLGNPKDGIGYIQLSGFASETGREMRNAIHALQRAAEDASDGTQSLQGLVLDLRGNPGGLLTSAVDVASLLVPKGSDIVSAKGRGFPGVLYRSRVDPILDSNTKLAVLINRGTASAAEIVSGAIQDLDVGLIVGSDRTFGKGLVQNVEELPFDSALKFTVAKYYTPSGRCIQGINYIEGGGLNKDDGGYVAEKISKKDRSVFYTKHGRVVRDGGGIEADFKVEAPQASALEVTLLRSGVLSDFAAEWSKTHELTNNFKVDEETYRSFQSFVAEKQRSGELELEVLYSKPLNDLKKVLKKSGYKGSEREVEALQASIVRDIQRDFDKYRKDIKEDISQSILARYVPESMLIERGVKSDEQVAAAVKLLNSQKRFDKLLARETVLPAVEGVAGDTSLRVAADETSVRGRVEW